MKDTFSKQLYSLDQNIESLKTLVKKEISEKRHSNSLKNDHFILELRLWNSHTDLSLDF